MRITWIQPEDVLAHEFVQAEHEGKALDDLRTRWITAGGATDVGRAGASSPPASPALVRLARNLLQELDSRPASVEYHAAEPRDLSAIRTSWPDFDESAAAPADLVGRLAAAWTGRLVGCLLGKVVEKLPRAGIAEILRSSGQWPLRSYITAAGVPAAVLERYPWNKASRVHSLAENIHGMPEDDDINYSLLALALLERTGRNFTSEDVAAAWLANLPAGLVFTAERAAYRNLLDAEPIERIAVTGNPFREWIGAAIRTDVYGWVNPGRPAAAAEMAWRDAYLSHTGSGLYSAMANAAMAACAVGAASAEAVLAAGRAVVPPASTLRAALDRAVDLGRRGLSDEDGLDALHREFGGLHWVHAVNNAALVAYAIARHGNDFDAAIALTATAGWDTDSTGATVGGIVGALTAPDGIDHRWTDPIGGRLHTSLPGFAGVTVDDLVQRTVAVARS